MSSQSEIRERVTNQIVAALETGGIPPWKKMWSSGTNCGLPTNIVSGQRYSGINPICLSLTAAANGWSSRFWGTFNQWADLKCSVRPRPSHVKPGFWGTKIVFCRPVERTGKDKNGDDCEERFWVLREYTVFNAEQVEGAAAERLLAPVNSEPRFDNFAPAEDVIQASGARIVYGDRAAYHPAYDFITLPHREAFGTHRAEFYSTAMHELAHWTGHPSRLDRLSKNARFGNDAYAFEELVAELSAAYVCAELGMPQSDDVTNTVAYLASWLRVLKSDHHAIFRAGSMASRAADMLLARPGQVNDTAEHVLAA